jgi:acyl carrier protein
MSQTRTSDDIKNSIKVFLLTEFLPGESPDALTDSTPLVTGGILDSLATVKLVGFVEKEFDVTLNPYELSAEYIDTLDLIAELVQGKQASG